jgi:hypothetical protein
MLLSGTFGEANPANAGGPRGRGRGNSASGSAAEKKRAAGDTRTAAPASPGIPKAGESEACALLITLFINRLSYRTFPEADMSCCDVCKQLKPDARNRPLLRVLDQNGNRTVDPFNGRLCDDCYSETLRFGTPAHICVLERISRTPRPKRAQQY